MRGVFGNLVRGLSAQQMALVASVWCNGASHGSCISSRQNRNLECKGFPALDDRQQGAAAPSPHEVQRQLWM